MAKSSPSRLSLLAVLLLAATALWVFAPLGARVLVSKFWQFPQSEQDAAVAAVGVLFSALAFAGIIYTILLQREELALQRLELAQTREELAGQRRQLEIQSQALLQQSFNDTLFRLLTVQSDITGGIQFAIRPSEYVVTGRQALVLIESEIHGRAVNILREQPETAPAAATAVAFADVVALPGADFSHYFTHLTQVLEFLIRADESRASLGVGLVRAQLSDAEKQLLLYYGVTPAGTPRFRQLLEAFGILSGIRRTELANKLRAQYASEAFRYE